MGPRIRAMEIARKRQDPKVALGDQSLGMSSAFISLVLLIHLSLHVVVLSVFILGGLQRVSFLARVLSGCHQLLMPMMWRR